MNIDLIVYAVLLATSLYMLVFADSNMAEPGEEQVCPIPENSLKAIRIMGIVLFLAAWNLFLANTEFGTGSGAQGGLMNTLKTNPLLGGGLMVAALACSLATFVLIVKEGDSDGNCSGRTNALVMSLSLIHI